VSVEELVRVEEDWLLPLEEPVLVDVALVVEPVVTGGTLDCGWYEIA